MRAIVAPEKQKFVVVGVGAAVIFFGLQAASRAIALFQISSFFSVSFYVYVFLIVWQTFVFDLHLKQARSWSGWENSVWRAVKTRFAYLAERHHWLSFQNYLVLPGVIYWSTVILIFLNPFRAALDQVWIAMATIMLASAFWYLKTVFYAHHDAPKPVRQMIFLVKLYASFAAFTAAFGISRFFGYGGGFLWLIVALMTFLLMYQALFQHHYIGPHILKFLFGSGVLLGALGYGMYFFWPVNYYSGALVLAAIYNTTWAIVHHKYIDENLTKELVYEYLAVLFVLLVIVFSSTNFAQRI